MGDATRPEQIRAADLLVFGFLLLLLVWLLHVGELRGRHLRVIEFGNAPLNLRRAKRRPLPKQGLDCHHGRREHRHGHNYDRRAQRPVGLPPEIRHPTRRSCPWIAAAESVDAVIVCE
jgi:hypothetical protein